MRNLTTLRNTSGASLFEVLLVCACTSTIAALAAPNMISLYHKTLAIHSTHQLLSGLQATRSLAVQTRKIATLCPSSNGKKCGRRWDDQLMIFIDLDKNGKRSENEEVIRVMSGVQSGGYLEWRAFRNPKYYIQYRPDGSTNYHNGTFAYCPPVNNRLNQRQIKINQAGRPRLAYKHEMKNKFCSKKRS